MNSIDNLIKTICIILDIEPLDGSYVDALGAYFNVVDQPEKPYNREVLVAALVNGVAPGTSEILIFDTYADFPSIGNDDTLYVTKDDNIIYRWDTPLNNYVLLNDPDVVNPDAPEEGQTFFARLATTDRLKNCTYNNGTGGVGATLTGNANGVLSQNNQTGQIDAVAPVLGNIVLIKNQVSQLQNGLYEVTQLGSVSQPFIITRIDGYNETEEVYPSAVFISAGSNNANKYFTQNTVDPVIGTNPLVYGVSATTTQTLPLLSVHTVLTDNLNATYAIGTQYATLPAYRATLTGNVNDSISNIENTNGVLLVSGMRVLVTGMTDKRYNGDYTVTQVGSSTLPYVLTRIGYNDGSLTGKARQWIVEGTSSTLRGSIYSLSNNYTLIAANIGVTGDLNFTKINQLSNILASGYTTGANDIIVTNHRSIASTNFDTTATDGYGELFLGDDSTTYNEVYLYRSADSNGDADCGIYTDNKGVVCTDQPANDANDRITVYSNNNIWIKSGGAINFPQNGEIVIENSIADIKIIGNGDVVIFSENNGIVVDAYNSIYGGRGDFGQNLSRNQLYLGNAAGDDFSWTLGNAAGAIVRYDGTDGQIAFNTGLLDVTIPMGNFKLQPGVNGDTYLEWVPDGDLNIYAGEGELNAYAGPNKDWYLGDYDENKGYIKRTAATSDIKIHFGVGHLVVSDLQSYVDDAAADADTNLPSGAFYKLNAGRAIYQKP